MLHIDRCLFPIMRKMYFLNSADKIRRRSLTNSSKFSTGDAKSPKEPNSDKKELWQCWTPPSTHNIYKCWIILPKYSQAWIGTVISWGTRSLRLLDCCQTQCDRTQTHLGHCAGSLLQRQANGQPRPSWCIFLTNTQQDRHTSSHGSVWRPLNHTFVRLLVSSQ